MHSINKYFITLTILTGIIFCSSCNSNKTADLKEETVKLTATLGGQGRFILSLQKPVITPEVIYVSTTLHNPTNDTIQFITWTCSYENLFKTNTDSFNIQSRFDCYSNFPTVMSIAPKSKVDHYIMISAANEKVKLLGKKFKIGMHFITPKKLNGVYDLIKQMKDTQDGKILWSNELDLSRFYRQEYH